MLKAVIFDMDGLLIDSEPLWEEAETDIYRSVGVPYTHELAQQTYGMRIDEVARYWHARYPWSEPTPQAVADQIVDQVAQLVKTKGQPLPGVGHAIEVISAAGLKMAIASSSSSSLIQAVLDKLQIHDHITIAHSAENEPYGKPHPGVYLSAAQRLGVRPEDCLTFEDSPSGVLSAKAAKMYCIAVPAADMLHDRRFAIADRVIGSLEDLTPEMLREFV